jgi:hypothetical protein
MFSFLENQIFWFLVHNKPKKIQIINRYFDKEEKFYDLIVVETGKIFKKRVPEVELYGFFSSKEELLAYLRD